MGKVGLRKFRVVLVVLSLLLLTVVSACGNTNGVNSSKVSTADNQQKANGNGDLKLGYATCAHCLPMSLTPTYTENIKLKATSFASGNDVLTALVSGSIDVAQVTYLHYITALDRGLDLVAISGQVNGGSDIVISNNVSLKEDDWEGLKELIKKKKKSGEKFRVAASRGNAQDIHMRGEFLKHDIDPTKDIEFINIANPADHASSLESGKVDMISTVEPFASQIRLSKVGKHFAYPYEQAAGKLTNLIVTRSDVVKAHKEELQEVVNGVVKLVDDLDSNKQIWLDVLKENTSLSEEVGEEALKNAYPDYRMHQKETLAIVKMMKELNYIQSDVSKKAVKNMDYSFLIKATGKTEEELGKQ